MRQSVTTAFALSLLLAACGGSKDSGTAAAAGGAAAPVAASGTITGFGSSLIVDGVPYDVSGATVTDDTDPANPAAATFGDLQLGQQVDVTLDRDGKPTHVGIGASVVGRIDAGSIDAAAHTFGVLGQPVAFTPAGEGATLFVGVQDAGGLQGGQLVKVHGTVDAQGVIGARLVVVLPAGAPLVQRVRGVVAGADAAAKTFRIGKLTVAWEGANVLPAKAAVEDGKTVVVFSKQEATGTPPALTLKADSVRVLHAEAAAREVVVRFGGPITALTPVAGQALPNFTLGALKVDSAKAKLEGGTDAAALVVGALVRVDGTLAGDVLSAREIAVLSGEIEHRVVLIGQVSSFVSPSSFVVRGTTVDGSSATFTHGSSAAQLADGVLVTILGHVAGAGVVADEITVHQPPPAVEMTLRGTVAKYDAAAQTFELVGMKMKLDAAVTWKDGSATDFVDGARVQVTGSYDGTVFVVKAVHFLKDATPSGGDAIPVHLSGVISGVTAQSFVLNKLTVAITSTTEIANGPLADGQRVFVVARKDASGALVALRVEVAPECPGPGGGDAGATRIGGPISEVTGAATFKVDAQLVDASKARFQPPGKSAADLAVGQVVGVAGKVSGGVLNAELVVFL